MSLPKKGLILNMVYFLAIIVFAIAILGLSMGIIFNKKPLQGSCGGEKGKLVIDGVELNCPVCGGDAEKCENK